MRRRFAVAAAALALSVALTVPAYAGTWKYVNDQWKYQRGTNKFAYNEWIKDNGKYYYIGNDGIMKTGWQQIDGIYIREFFFSLVFTLCQNIRTFHCK